MYRFYQILHFVLKNYLNFKLYENMLILFYDLFSCLIKYNFVLGFMYITSHLHVIKDSWILFFLFNRFFYFSNFQIPQISNCECFLTMGNQSTSFQKKNHQNSIIKRVFNLVIYNITPFDVNVVQVQRSFIKTKTQNNFFPIFILNSSTLILII